MTASRDFGHQIVQLGRVVPGHPGPVIAVIDIFFAPVSAIDSLEDDGCIASIVIMVFEIDPHLSVPRKIRPVEAIGGERAVIQGDEPVGMLDDPSGIDSHMIGYHIA